MKKFVKISLIVVAALVLAPAAILTALYRSADMGQPADAVNLADWPVADSAGVRTCPGGSLRQNGHGLWEMYLEGAPLERGVAFGRLAEDLLLHQETVFVDQIREFIPSDSYLKFLRFFLVVFNRNLGEYVPEEFRREIYGVSLSCTHAYDDIGTPYERQLNYHAAHDIGHAMQQYMLVGCSSFGVWDGASADSALIVGRNFDFYMGEGFARDKLVSFVRPDEGHPYASVGWAGMVGVLSGMNREGLTVTINAAKGPMPTSAATPISILAREILQYAATIDEAYEIARRRRTFVSESMLIGSARDGRAAVIEKTPSRTALYESPSDRVICTNHYQSQEFAEDKANLENIAQSDSPYRFRRIASLLDAQGAITPASAAAVLRDRLGERGEDIGLCNEMSVNQSIAHHSVIFKPSEGLMWVSTAPWQSGEYICYDLNAIFGGPLPDGRIDVADAAIAADSLFLARDYRRVAEYRSLASSIRRSIRSGNPLPEDSLDRFHAVNPEMFYVYQLAGEYYDRFGDTQKAADEWRTALTKEIPRLGERRGIEKQLKKVLTK